MKYPVNVRTVAILLFGFAALSIVSLIACGNTFPSMHFWSSWPPGANALLTAAGMLLAFGPLFLLARFSFGYLVGFSLFSAVFGFVWISFVSQFQYEHAVARWSMITALVAALLPLLFVSWDLPRPRLLLDRRLIEWGLGALALAVLVADAGYGLRMGDPYSELRSDVTRPPLLNYLTGIVIVALLPYLFARLVSRGLIWKSVAVLVIGLCFYPVVLNKTVLILPLWLPFLHWLYGRFDPRAATILSLGIPMSVGLADFAMFYTSATMLPLIPFGTINMRMLGVPALALDHYADFFTHHDLTYFCHISVIRRLAGCTYGELGPTIAAVYHDGNFNASFLATEGIAAVGLAWAPASALICGLVLAVGSLVSGHLSPRFLAVSAGMAIPAIMNVPLGTALLTNGVGVLFLLWWLTPTEP